MAMAVGAIMVVGAIGEAAIMVIGTIIPVDIGIAMATTMTGTVAVIMVTAIMMMTDPTSA
ncbi:MAG: hypothetical protein WBO09_12295 [Methylocystis silviterrae]